MARVWFTGIQASFRALQSTSRLTIGRRRAASIGIRSPSFDIPLTGNTTSIRYRLSILSSCIYPGQVLFRFIQTVYDPRPTTHNPPITVLRHTLGTSSTRELWLLPKHLIRHRPRGQQFRTASTVTSSSMWQQPVMNMAFM